VSEDNRAGSEPLTDKPATEERPGVVVQNDAGPLLEIAPVAEKEGAKPAAKPAETNIETQQVHTTKIECSRGLADWLVMNNVSLAFTPIKPVSCFSSARCPTSVSRFISATSSGRWA
jgi:hypothetical protein